MESRFYSFQISPQNCKKRAKFAEIEKKLQQFKIVYAMLYPSQLRVVALGETHFFYAPNEALMWLEKNEVKIRSKQKDQERSPRD